MTRQHVHMCRLQNPDKAANTADAPLRYSARSSGNCLDYNFPRQPRTTQTTTPAAQAPKRCDHIAHMEFSPSLGQSVKYFFSQPPAADQMSESDCQNQRIHTLQNWRHSQDHPARNRTANFLFRESTEVGFGKHLLFVSYDSADRLP